jgi:hypothetical protein
MQNDDNVRMNWFERHLNWTALGMGTTSLILHAISLFVGIGFDIFGSSGVRTWSVSTLLTILASISCLLFSIIGYTWVLYQKNRSLKLLVFFLPIIIAGIVNLFSAFFLIEMLFIFCYL